MTADNGTSVKPGEAIENYLAGVLSAYPEYADRHPVTLVPMARQILDALAEWEPEW